MTKHQCCNVRSPCKHRCRLSNHSHAPCNHSNVTKSETQQTRTMRSYGGGPGVGSVGNGGGAVGSGGGGAPASDGSGGGAP